METHNYSNVLFELQKDLDAILESIHDDVLITDGAGVIIRVSPSFEKLYNVAGNEVLGNTVYDLQRKGIFRPSVTAKVLESGNKVTMLQENQFNRKIVVTATPIKDNSGKITKVVSFSRDMTDYINLKNQYEELENDVRRYEAEISELRNKKINYPGVIAESSNMKQALYFISKVAPFDANVLLLGESGVGKTMFASLIHKESSRAEGPFVEINCGAIPENLLESELFGYEKGAFTGANREGKIGLIELAEKGTLFLDEISELSTNLQAKLLKVIQDKTFNRIGSNKTIKVDFRLISASNKSLGTLVETKEFREDLFYRLNVMSLAIPPLRNRANDILPLTQSIIGRLNDHYHLNKSMAPGAITKLLEHHWPGNVRELENVLERALLTSEHDLITEKYLALDCIQRETGLMSDEKINLFDALKKLECKMVCESYKRHGTTIGVAKELGISQPTATRKIKEHT